MCSLNKNALTSVYSAFHFTRLSFISVQLSKATKWVCFPFRFNPQDPHLGRPCWRQLLRRRSLLGGKDASSPQGGAISLDSEAVLSSRVSFRSLRMRSPSPLCWSTTTTWSTSTRTCKLSLSLVHWARVTPLWSTSIHLVWVWSSLIASSVSAHRSESNFSVDQS